MEKILNESKVFIDSNIWLYCFLADQDPDPQEDQRKRSLAISLTKSENIVISVQVINEVCAVLIRRAKLREEDISNLIDEFLGRCIVMEMVVLVIVNASQLRRRYNFSFWDSLMVASAMLSGAKVLYSEDLQDGWIVDDRLRITNPFKIVNS